MVSPLKVATPPAKSAVALLMTPVPEVMVAVTVPVKLVSVLPEASTARTTGWVESATPLVAVAAGSGEKARAEAEAAFSVMVEEVAVLRVKESVNVRV